ncbi:lipid-A-disaccharide synthase [Opitutaceae bacterium TAV4]|uniref:lipid-A-disaccharide synthase n=1 Tax=Geminisphaera colitermitum TaxID=1148786 RepID=UPI0001965315|nr:lipid-A-disaccharide synthase [Geminisphaera colitermitum]RRJ95473.1 lipid-A-disaccharide synthase [Opitutaceae bacterium TAV4]RRJ98401.1 lipid-A-disaccharide synthase [Opitutaceae bacterium TAV3]
MSDQRLQLPFRLSPPEGGRVDLLIIAGEHSGDEHAARIVADLRRREPGLNIAALGGPRLDAAGAQLLHDMTTSSVVGLVEVLKNYSFFKALFNEILRWIGVYRPRAVLFVDYPGLNLRLAAALHERKLSIKGGGDIRLLYYISPQIWAWKGGRRFKMARHLDALAVIFPFEVECYKDTALPVEFVGHPFLDTDYQPPVRYDPDGPVLLLPGSRKQAVARIFPVLLAGFTAARESGREAVVLYPSEAIRSVLEQSLPPSGVRLVRMAEGVTVAASAVLMSSGTMSLHVALAAIPGAIAYRANPLTYLLGRMLVKIPYLGIANLLLREPMYPEYLQGAASPEALAGELGECFENSERLIRTRDHSEKLRTLLRQPATGTATDWVLRHL